jgi:hypothetical protein
MDSTVAGSEVTARQEGLLEPLPTLKLVKSVEKLDAGLRSLDHCKQLPFGLLGSHRTDVKNQTERSYHYGATRLVNDSSL